MVPKTVHEVYASITIVKYIITFHQFSVLCQRRSCCWKYRKWDSLLKYRKWGVSSWKYRKWGSLFKYRKWGSPLKNRYYYAKMVGNAKISFSISPYCTPLFTRKENLEYFKAALSAVLCNGVVGCIMNVWGYQHENTANITANIYLLRKTAIKALKQGVKFIQT